MTPKWVKFVSDEPPEGATPIDSRIVDRWRTIVRDRLLYRGDSDSITGVAHRVFGRTLVAAMPAGYDKKLTVWWTFESDETALVLAVRVVENEPTEIEKPPSD